MNPTRIGLVTGVKAEQDAFRPDQPRERVDDRRLNGLSVYRIDVAEPRPATVWACTAGVGKVNATMAATTLLTHFDLDLLAIIGTAGNISTVGDGPALAVGPYLLVEAVHGDYGAYRGGRFVPYRAGTLPIGEADTSPFRSGPAAEALAADPTLPTARIATGDSFVEDADRSRTLALDSGAALVDMETAAVAQVAERAGVPWLAVKAISDDANADSATDFAQRLAEASREAAELFESVLELAAVASGTG